LRLPLPCSLTLARPPDFVSSLRSLTKSCGANGAAKRYQEAMTKKAFMYRALFLAAGLISATPAVAVPGWDEPSNSAFPQSVLTYGAPPAPGPAQRGQAMAAANLPAPNGTGNAVPNSPPTANPPGAGASSSATLQEHGETAANPNGMPAR
jgi:hypothetical protein